MNECSKKYLNKDVLEILEEEMKKNVDIQEIIKEQGYDKVKNVNELTLLYAYIVGEGVKSGIRDNKLMLEFLYYNFGDELKNDKRFHELFDEFLEIELEDYEHIKKFDSVKDIYFIGNDAIENMLKIFDNNKRLCNESKIELTEETKEKILKHLMQLSYNKIKKKAEKIRKIYTNKELYIVNKDNLFFGPYKSLNEARNANNDYKEIRSIDKI
jgi:hypothetical protein